MRILGIDPGFERLGIAVLEGSSVLFSECFKTDKKLEFPERLSLIGEEIKKVIKKWKPEVLAIETLFLTNNERTVMKVSEARGVVLYEASKARLKIFEASPPQIKLAVTGDGRADKTQIIKMVQLLTKLDKNKQSDDELDAVAVALTAKAHLKK